MVKDHGKCGASSKASISLVTHSYIILYLQFNSLLPVRVKVSAECAPHVLLVLVGLPACSFPVSFRPHCRQPLSISLLDSFASFVFTNTLSRHLVHCDLHRVLKLCGRRVLCVPISPSGALCIVNSKLNKSSLYGLSSSDTPNETERTVELPRSSCSPPKKLPSFVHTVPWRQRRS